MEQSSMYFEFLGIFRYRPKGWVRVKRPTVRWEMRKKVGQKARKRQKCYAVVVNCI